MRWNKINGNKWISHDKQRGKKVFSKAHEHPHGQVANTELTKVTKCQKQVQWYLFHKWENLK